MINARITLFLHLIATILLLVNTLSIRKRSVDNPVTQDELFSALDVIQRARIQQAFDNSDDRDVYPQDGDYTEDVFPSISQLGKDSTAYDYLNLDGMIDSPVLPIDENDMTVPDDVDEEGDEKRPLEKSEVASIFETPSEKDVKEDDSVLESAEKVTLGPGQVAEIFSQEKDKDIKNVPDKLAENESESNDNTEDEEDLKKEWLQSLSDAVVLDDNDNSKTKRSTPSTDKDMDENLKSKAIDILKIYVAQQDEENKHLARALSLATRSQAERTDRYVFDEISELEAAAANEHLIKSLRNIIASDSSADNKSSSDEDKRSATELAVNPVAVLSGGSKESPEEDGPKQSSEEEAIMLELLKNKLIDLEAKENMASQEDNSDALISEYNRYRLNPFYRDVMNPENSETNPLTVAEAETMLAEPALSAYCPAVADLSDNCLAARSQQLMLDAEAAELCNRHQLCYACGIYHGMTADTCDHIYATEVAKACGEEDDDSRCHKEAFGLYAVMVQTHAYVPDIAKVECASACVYDYIAGRSGR